MHALQPNNSRLKGEDVEKLLSKINISLSQLPKIKAEDPALPEGCNVGDIIKVERKSNDKTFVYYRAVI